MCYKQNLHLQLFKVIPSHQAGPGTADQVTQGDKSSAYLSKVNEIMELWYEIRDFYWRIKSNFNKLVSQAFLYTGCRKNYNSSQEHKEK